MTRLERARRAIRFEGPDKVPVLNLNRDQQEGDILIAGLARSDGDRSEWGYKFETRNDGTMGHPGEPALHDWAEWGQFRCPALCAEERLAVIHKTREASQDHYLLAGLGITGFNLFTFLRGFENSITDLLLYQDEADALLDMIFGHEIQLIELAARGGCHGVHFADDWGSQEALLVDPPLWRSVFKERYRKQFDCAHALGMEAWFHSCGNVGEILADFHEIGVDVMNISQPNVVDLETAAQRLAGKQCFMLPISYQTVSISGTPAEIIQEAKRLHGLFGVPQGGYIGYVEEYSCMGMSEENYQACRRAFALL